MTLRGLCLGIATCAALGCGDGGAPAAQSGATASSAPAQAATSSGPARAASAAISAAPAATAAPHFEDSPEPALKEWATSKVVRVPGSTGNSCETRMVREWLRVQCVNRSAERGAPVSISVTRGRAAGERFQGENLKVVNDITTLLVPVRPGVDFAASFRWEKGEDELSVKWPEGSPESERTMTFQSGLEDAKPSVDGAPSASAAAPPAEPPKAEAPKVEPPQDDAPGLAAPPDEDAWAKLPEAKVKGSTKAGCETKLSGDWFRARCAAKDAASAYKTVTPIKGHRKSQTTVKIEGDVATLLTPYVEGTELHVRFERASESETLVLRWTKGPKPDTIGAFEAVR